MTPADGARSLPQKPAVAADEETEKSMTVGNLASRCKILFAARMLKQDTLCDGKSSKT